MKRVILHSDCDSFYASVEMLYHPEYRDKPFAVGGDPEQRHGIVLAKSQKAKLCGVKTGEALWQAKQKCPDIVFIPPNFQRYIDFSNKVREIYMQYTDMVESFGLDECWLDITGSLNLFGQPYDIAKEIQKRIWNELGITVSIGVSFNKIFAKLGSDYKKPCGITVITKDNFKEIVWTLPVADLLMVGRVTNAKLQQRFIKNIGDLANANPDNLHRWLGKHGDMLHAFANGHDNSPVSQFNSVQAVKSIGNSTATPRDLENDEDVKIIMYTLAESVARRMRDQGFKGRVITISIRDNQLSSITRQRKISKYTNLTTEIAIEAMKLFRINYNWNNPIRSLGVSLSDFEHESAPTQTNFFSNEIKREKMEQLDKAIDRLKNRFGSSSIVRAIQLSDIKLSGINPYDDHNIYPVSFMK